MNLISQVMRPQMFPLWFYVLGSISEIVLNLSFRVEKSFAKSDFIFSHTSHLYQ